MYLDLKSTSITSHHLDIFYDLLDLDLKNTWTTYFTELGLILLYIGLGLIKLINQSCMLLEKYEEFHELSVEQLFIQSSPVPLGQVMCGVVVKIGIFCIQQMLCKSKSNPVPCKR